MLFSRVGALFLVLVCIILLSWGGIALLQGVGSTITHGSVVEHNEGTVIALSQDGNLVLMTANGVHKQFHCVQRCLIERDHIVRHIREHAHTDVYYVEMPDKTLDATDVD